MWRAYAGLALAIVAALVLGLALLVSGDDSAATLAAGPRLASRVEGPQSRTERMLDSLSAGAAEERSAPASGELDAALVDAGERASAARSLLLVDSLTHVPLEGASVRYVQLGRGVEPRVHAAWVGATCGEWLREPGPRVTSDAAGRAELVSSLEAAVIAVAQHQGRIARSLFEAGEQGEQTLELVPDADLELLVLGDDSAPLQDAAVALRRRFQGWSEDRRTLRTSADGRARFDHVGLEFEPGDEGLWSLALVGLVEPSAEQGLDANALPREPIVLRAGSSGALEVRVLGLDGSPLESGSVELEVVERGAELQRSFWKRAESAGAPLVNGVARFERVRLGEHLSLSIDPAGAPAPPRRRVDGPRARGELVRVDVQLGDDQPVLALRLLDDGGAALAERSIRWRVDTRSEHVVTSSDGELRSDVQGRILLALADPWAGGDRRSLSLALAGDAEATPRAELDVSREFAPGRHELGDVTLRLPPIAAAGRVVDAQGAPAAGARVHLTELARDSDRPSRGLDLEVECDARGTFCVRGGGPAARFTLRASTLTARSAPQTVECGAVDLLLRLAENGSLVGRLLLDPDVSLEALAVRLELLGADRSESEALLQRSGVFSAFALEPGVWTLGVYAQGQREPLATLEGLRVDAGAPCADARLEALDLRGRVTTIRLELTPPRPSDRVLGVVLVTPRAPDAAPFEHMLHDRRLTFALGSASADLRIELDGFRTVERRGVRGDVRVELERGPLVRLRVPLGVELPRPPYFLKPFLKPAGSDSTMLGHFQDATLGADREVVLHAPGAGEFEVEWLLEKRLESMLTTAPISEPSPQRIKVLDSQGEQVFDLRVPLEELASAIERGL